MFSKGYRKVLKLCYPIMNYIKDNIILSKMYKKSK